MGLWEAFGMDHFWEDFFGGYKNRKQREKAEQQIRGLFAQAALRAFRDYQADREARSRHRSDNPEPGRDVQYEDGNVKVDVTNGYSRDYDRYTTDIVVAPRDDNSGVKLHVVFDEDGNELLNEWHPGHLKKRK